MPSWMQQPDFLQQMIQRQQMQRDQMRQQPGMPGGMGGAMAGGMARQGPTPEGGTMAGGMAGGMAGQGQMPQLGMAGGMAGGMYGQGQMPQQNQIQQRLQQMQQMQRNQMMQQQGAQGQMSGFNPATAQSFGIMNNSNRPIHGYQMDPYRHEFIANKAQQNGFSGPELPPWVQQRLGGQQPGAWLPQLQQALMMRQNRG